MRYLFLFVILLIVAATYGSSECELCKFGVKLLDTIIINNQNLILDRFNSTCYKVDPPHCNTMVKLLNMTMNILVNTPVEELCVLQCK